MDASTPFKPAAADAERSLVIRKLRKEYRAGQPVLKDVSLTVEGRGMTAIIGPSGGVHPLGWTGVMPFNWRSAGRGPLQT